MGNFREAEIFTIFAIKSQLVKICSRKNFFLQKFLADELRKSTTVCLSRRSSKSTEILVEPSSKLRKFFVIYDNSPVITATVNRSSELVPSLWHGSFSPTATGTL